MCTRSRHVSVWINKEEYKHLKSQARVADMEQVGRFDYNQSHYLFKHKYRKKH